jgi:homospermidine synthase
MLGQNFKKYLKFDTKLLIIGFGSIGKAVIPLIFRHIDIQSEQITIVTKSTDGFDLANEYNLNLILTDVNRENYQAILDTHLCKGGFLLNLSVDVSSIDLIKHCQNIDALYLDTCIEPWAGGYTDKTVSPSYRSNYALRESALALKNNTNIPTAILAHGANPGLVSHFVKQALINIANDNNIQASPTSKQEWAMLADKLNIKVIHIAEHDTQVSRLPKRKDEFVNTWSIDGFVSEGSQPAELGWGTHERYWPHDGMQHDFGCKSAIYLDRPGASTRVRTWTPEAGPFHAFLITHNEAISIADYFTHKVGDSIHYRPTVHYAYHPCEDAVLSVHELAGREWQQQSEQRLLNEEIIDGMDELGVLLMGNTRGAYWCGSALTIHEARDLAPCNTATSLQVAIGVLAGMLWAIEHPNKGVIEADDIDYRYIMDISLPYLGKVQGHYTDWTPIKDRERLFSEELDKTDPWQFINIRVS